MTCIMEIGSYDSVGCIVTRLQTGYLRIPSRDTRFLSFAMYPDQHLGGHSASYSVGTGGLALWMKNQPRHEADN